jgi:hypothetical protein
MAEDRGRVYSNALFAKFGLPPATQDWRRTVCGDEEENAMNQYLLVAGLLGELTPSCNVWNAGKRPIRVKRPWPASCHFASIP